MAKQNRYRWQNENRREEPSAVRFLTAEFRQANQAISDIPLSDLRTRKSHYTTMEYRRRHKTGEFSEWMTLQQRAIAKVALARMVR